MLRGLYTAAAGMLANTVSTDVMANNLANVNTAGYKRSGVNFQAFPEMLIQRMSKDGAEQIGTLTSGNQVREAVINFTQGSMRETGGTFDMAIEGDGFFTVKESNAPGAQEFYTRAGNLMVNEQGYLVTASGQYVQGDNGSIRLPLDQPNAFTVSAKGQISAGDQTVGRLKITQFENNNMLVKKGDNLYEASDLATVRNAPGEYQVHQGRIEQSNTNVVSELVNNIQGLRLYEALQKNIHFHNETLGKAVNDVGRARG